MFGDWSIEPVEGQDHVTYFTYLLFVFCSFILSLTMVNLLVAVFSDTYGRVMSNIEISDMKELNDLILELESFAFWNRSKGERQHLVYVEYDDEGSKKWGGLADETAKKVNLEMKSMGQRLSDEIDSSSKDIEETLSLAIEEAFEAREAAKKK